MGNRLWPAVFVRAISLVVSFLLAVLSLSAATCRSLPCMPSEMQSMAHCEGSDMQMPAHWGSTDKQSRGLCCQLSQAPPNERQQDISSLQEISGSPAIAAISASENANWTDPGDVALLAASPPDRLSLFCTLLI